MAKKKFVEESYFVDDMSNIEYHWLKEETERANGVSCWIAEDTWGNKDHFIVSIKEGEGFPTSIIKGPYRTIKETLEALSLKEDSEAENPVVENEGEGYVNAGLLDEVYQLITLESEKIRKLNSLMCYADDVQRDEIIGVLSKITEASNANLGMLQELTKSISPSAEAIDDGEEEAKDILDNGDESFDFNDEDEEEDKVINSVAEAFNDSDIDVEAAIQERYDIGDISDDEIAKINF